MNPQSTQIYISRLLSTPEAQLSSSDIESKRALFIVLAILDPRDNPSVAGYVAKVVNRFFAEWLQQFPRFDSIAKIEASRSATTGELYYVLWLLSDYLDSQEQRRLRMKQSAIKIAEWEELRYRFWLVKLRLETMGIAQTKITEILTKSWEGISKKITESMTILELLGFKQPVDPLDIEAFHRTFRLKPGHTYYTPIDFTQSDNENQQ